MRKQKITRKRWTAEELDTVKKMTKENKSNLEIGRVLRRTPLSIYQQRMKLGLERGETYGPEKRSTKPSPNTSTKLFWSTL